MRKEFWLFLSCGVFFVIVTPIYWALSHEVTGAVAMVMAMLLFFMISFYLWFVTKAIPERPEDRKDGEIVEGAGELGFFPPYSWWPLFAAMAFGALVLGVVFGWWMFIMAIPFGAICVVGWLFEYYRGAHAH